ncbi:polysaccharide biosynthesis tyrosine autokinase [Nocardioides coralli]|uniref:polysaccharide biosynthesis tyrosine autokinase n=1 Tax=Nocardioides coralli TaxID=2872154 RepID=UPI001CA4325F|nr:polysaccharide biosynthesis tyrosine autokinase [Nocardioides coralli]QZY28771.1 polysaccharide biosynthesis tyrosine autokinase [Nocardioides coralli]
MELRDYWNTIRRRWVTVVACLVLAVAAASLVTWQTTPLYQSTAKVFVSTSEKDTATAYQGGLFATQRVASYADLVNEPSTAERVSSALGGDLDPTMLEENVEATVVPETVILEISFTHPDAEVARDVAATYATGMREIVADLETPAGKDRAPINASMYGYPQVPDSPVSPQPVRNLGLAVVLGLMLGVGLAVSRELLDTSVSSPEDVRTVTEAPILGNLHTDPKAVSEHPASVLKAATPWSEAFRVLRTNMQYVEVDHNKRVFVVTSALPGEGKSTTAVNLAVTLALAKQRVVLVECDLRRPMVAKRLKLDDAVGTTSVLIGQVSIDDALQPYRSTGLSVLTSGPIPPNPSELLQSVAMEKLLGDLRDRFDVVILDAPPLLPVTDSALLSAQADGAIVVVRHGKTTRDQLDHALDRVEAVDAKTAGIVMNLIPAKKARSGYGYGYGNYTYGPEPSKPTSRRAKGRRSRRDA